MRSSPKSVIPILTKPSVSSVGFFNTRLVVIPSCPMENNGPVPPRTTSTRPIVSSRRITVEFSKNDNVGGGYIAPPSICMDRKGASDPPGNPRTSMLAPDWPLEDSTHRPGENLSKSAVVLGENFSISSEDNVVTEKLTSNLLCPALATPVTTISSIRILAVCSSWVSCALAATIGARANDAVSVARKPNREGRPCWYLNVFIIAPS